MTDKERYVSYDAIDITYHIAGVITVIVVMKGLAVLCVLLSAVVDGREVRYDG